MKNSERKHHIPEEKVSILRRHLIEKVPVSNLCEEFDLHPTVFYRWLKQFFENGAAAFQNHRPDSGRQRDQERIAGLERKLQAKNEVLAELMEEHVALKKSWGELNRPWHPAPLGDTMTASSGSTTKKRLHSISR